MSAFYIKNFGFHETYSPVPTNVNYDKHMHNNYELYYFLHGDVDYIVGNMIYHLQRHDLLFIRPSIYHYPKMLSDTPYHRIVINFDAEHIRGELCGELDKLRTHYRIPPDSLIAKYYDNCAAIVDRYDESDIYPCLTQNLDLILTELKYSNEFTDAEKPATIHPIFDKILNYIDNNLGEPLGIEKLSEEFFVSPSWIKHSFRKFLNISAMEYINRKKILYAQQLIVGGTPAFEAAERCGFKNYSTFFLQYKKILGISPVKSKVRE